MLITLSHTGDTTIEIGPQDFPALSEHNVLGAVLSRPELYSLEQIADMLGVDVSTVRTWITSHKLAAVKISNKVYRVFSFDLIAFLQANRHPCADGALNREDLQEVRH